MVSFDAHLLQARRNLFVILEKGGQKNIPLLLTAAWGSKAEDFFLSS